jgi:hypothetical protein
MKIMLERNSSRSFITNPLPGLLLIVIHPHELSIELKTEESEEGDPRERVSRVENVDPFKEESRKRGYLEPKDQSFQCFLLKRGLLTLHKVSGLARGEWNREAQQRE